MVVDLTSNGGEREKKSLHGKIRNPGAKLKCEKFRNKII